MSPKRKKPYASPEESELDKLKLLAEHGGEFMQFGDIPAEIEQEFIKQIKKFQEKFREAKSVSIYEIIGRPVIKEISNWSEEKKWAEIQRVIQVMARKQILFEVISELPAETLYRFITQELYAHEVPYLRMKGWNTFIFYEDFVKSPENEMKIAAHTFLGSLISTEMPLDIPMMEPMVVYQGSMMSREEAGSQVNTMKSLWHESLLNKIRVKYLECSDDRDFIDGTAWIELKKTMRSKRKTIAFGFQLHFNRRNEKLSIAEISFHLPAGLLQ